MKKRSLFIVFFFFVASLSAQKVWTLQDCFDHAMQNNISLKKMMLSQDFAKNDFTQSKMNIYMPNINGSIGESFNFGNSVDPTTYQFVRSATNATSFGVALNYNLFQGLSRIHALKSSKEKLNATQLEAEELKNNTKIAIANLYLQILIAKEVLALNQQNKSLTQNQLKNTQALVDAGVLAQGELLNINAQLGQNDLAVLNAQNNVEKALNQLKMLLQVNLYEPFEIAAISIPENINVLDFNPQQISNEAANVLPQLKKCCK